MILGVPTLNRYDLLSKLIVSAEAGRLKPSTYLIVDNGGRFDAEAHGMPGIAAARMRGAGIVVLTPEKNLGVAASWNAILDWAHAVPVVISNDDVELGEGTLEALECAVGKHDFVIAEGGYNANGWCLFAQTARCTELVGPYDENFFPAYCEDRDYAHRLFLAGVTVHREPATLRHEGWATMKADPSISEGQQRSVEYFEKKWGGTPDTPIFTEPFNGLIKPPDLRRNPPQTEWRSYGRSSESMRWDVVNHVAKTVAARSYLEIGVCAGESMRHVNGVACALEKWGVDPSPREGAIEACDVFSQQTSDEFFETTRRAFDVVFVDGLHYADQAYRDIMNAARSARVIVVHDSSPATEMMQVVPYPGGDWTGDVWKAIARIRAEGKHTVRTVDTDFGVAVVIPNRPETITELPRGTWDDLVQHRKELLGLVSVFEWKNWFDGAIKCV